MEFGRKAAEELTALLDGGPARTVQVPVPRLIERESTGGARSTLSPGPGGASPRVRRAVDMREAAGITPA